jgi:hypothetical protein
MSWHSVTIRLSFMTPWSALSELNKVVVPQFLWTSIELMQLKGLKYIPAIIYTGNFISSDSSKYSKPFLDYEVGLPSLCLEEINRAFELLKRKVDVKIATREFRKEYAKWPIKVLDLKEVRDEINQLVAKPLLSKEVPEDRMIAKKLGLGGGLLDLNDVHHDEKIDAVIEKMNKSVREIADFFLKILEIYKKYPNTKLLFHTEVFYY